MSNGEENGGKEGLLFSFADGELYFVEGDPKTLRDDVIAYLQKWPAWASAVSFSEHDLVRLKKKEYLKLLCDGVIITMGRN